MVQEEQGLKSLSPALAAGVAEVLAQPHLRITRVAAGGQAVWVKQAEQLSLRWRLQKGDTQAALERDRAGLHDFQARGLPVPPILAEGPGYFVTPDIGAPLSDLLRDPQAAATRRPAFTAAGAALAQFHRAGVAHGRPSLRDICWDGTTARFIDFERYRPGQATLRSQAMDVVILLHSVVAIARTPVPELDVLFDGWQAGAPAGLVPKLTRLLAQFGWLGGAAARLARIKPNSRDLGAVPILITWLRGRLA